MEERVQKILARAGYGSRRACEDMITQGRVSVNGVEAILGTKVDIAKDQIKIDGSLLNYHEPEKVYIMLNKPRFVLSDRDASDPRQSVFSIVPDSQHLFVVGRLDFESEGLILLTNDGDLANKLSHPRYGKEKEYQVLVAKRPDDKQLKAWRHGIVLEDGDTTGPAQVVVSGVSGKGAWLRVIMTEGRKRQIRMIGRTIGLPIVRLIRTRIGTLELDDLKTGEFKPLTEKQVKDLRVLVSGKAAVKRQEEAEARAETRSEGEKSYGRKPYAGRSAGGRTSGKPYAKSDGDRPYRKSGDKPYAKSGSKPFEKKDGDKTYRKDGDKPYERKDGDRPYRGDGAKPYAKSGSRPYEKKDGDRPYRKDGDKPYERKDGDRPYRKDGDKPYERKDGDKPFTKGGAKPYGRKDGDKPYRKDGSKPYDKKGGSKPYDRKPGNRGSRPAVKKKVM